MKEKTKIKDELKKVDALLKVLEERKQRLLEYRRMLKQLQQV